YQTASDLEADLRRFRRDNDSSRSHIASAVVAAPVGSRPSRWKVVAGALVVAVAAVVAAGMLLTRKGPVLKEREPVILSEFVDSTGDSAIDGTLKQALAVQLEQSPYMNVFPDSGVRETLRLMGRSADERVTEAVARDMCARENIKAIVRGSIASLGKQ